MFGWIKESAVYEAGLIGNSSWDEESSSYKVQLPAEVLQEAMRVMDKGYLFYVHGTIKAEGTESEFYLRANKMEASRILFAEGSTLTEGLLTISYFDLTHVETEVADLMNDVTDLKTSIDSSLGIEKPLNYSTGTTYNVSISPSVNKWNVAPNVMGYIIPLSQVSKITIKSNTAKGSIFALLKTDNHVHNTTPDYATGSDRTFIPADITQTVSVPSDANYLYITDHLTNNVSYLPQSVMLSTYLDASATIEEISDIENDLNVLKSYHPNYSGKKLSILGDSISTFVPTADKVDGKAPEGCTTTYPGNMTQYEKADVTSASLTWWGRVLTQFHMVLGINESWAGSCIAYNPNNTNGGKYTADNCLCSETRIRHLGENGTPDIIIVFGGTNDINHHRVGSTEVLRYAVGELDSTNNPYSYDDFPMVTDTYYGSITTMLLRIQHAYPNATILMLLPYFCTYTHTSSGDIATPQDQNLWCNAAIDVCKFLGVEYLDLRTIINMYDVSTLLFDGLHPKANGMEAIANAVIHKLNSIL